MVYVGSSWVELDYWTSPIGNDEDVRMRVLAKSSQNVAGNYSRIDFKLQKRITGGSAFNYYNRDFTIKMDGHSASQKWVLGSITDTSWTDVGGDTSDMYWANVSHNADGTLTISANAYGDRPMSGEFDTDITIELPRIPRASVPTCSPNPLTIGSSGATLTVNTNRKSSSFNHTIKVQCGSWSWTSSARAVGASVNVSIPYSVIAQFSATSKTATATITCTTFNGTTQIGSAQTCSCTFQINTSVDHPNVGTITVQDTNSRTSAIVGAETFIYGISTLSATIPLSVSGSYTQLASATVTCGTKSQTYTLSGTSQTITFVFDKVNASSLTVTVKDKRGTSVSGSKSYTLMAYQPVTATATVGRVTATGSTAVGQVSGVAYGGNYGQASNSLTITYKYKEHDATTWTDSAYTATLTLNEGQQTYTHAITLLEEYDYRQQYDIQFIVNDLFNTATYTAQLMQGLPILSWDETEVDVFGDLHIHGRDNPTVWQDVMQGFDGVLAHDGVKNILPILRGSATINGITFTVNEDGTVKANGTASGAANFDWNFIVPITGEYTLSGCPANGSAQTYEQWVYNNNTSSSVGMDDFGDGATQTLEAGTSYNVNLRIASGYTANNLVFKPMIRDARLASDEYVRTGKWKYWGQTNGTASKTLPSYFEELYIVVKYAESNNTLWAFTLNVPFIALETFTRFYPLTARIGGSYSSDFGGFCVLSRTSYNLNSFMANRSNVASSCVTNIYFR